MQSKSVIESNASDHATATYIDIAARTFRGKYLPSDSIISTFGTDHLVKHYNLASWEIDGKEFCQVYNQAYALRWKSLDPYADYVD